VPSDDLGSKIAEFEAAGKTIVVIGWDGAERGLVAVSDTAREGSSEAIQAFAELGLDAVLVSGDNENATRWLARSVGIERVLAGVLPHEKAQAVSDLQRKGEVVAMVGDGVNDAPALAQADLGIAVASGTDVAIETSDITLVTPDLRLAVDAVRLARRTLRTIKENLFWAFVYNAAAIPIAAAGLLNPIIAAAAMSASSLLVVSNSLRLRRFRRSWS
jgi:P-type Cu+ transporter